MARKLREVTGTSKRLEKLRGEAKKLSGLDKALLDDILVEYDALASMTEDLRFMVIEQGVMLEGEDKTIENPAFTAYQKAIGRLGDVAKKASDFAKRSDEEVEEDELASFLRR